MKRSAQVALLLMGVGSVGAATYAISPPRNNCVPQDSARPSAVAPNPAATSAAEPCPPRRQGIASGRSHYTSYSRTGSSSSGWSIFGRGSATSTVPRSSRTSSGSRGTTSRGGFGGTGHSISSGG